MSTGIGSVTQGEFMSSKSLVEAARIVLSAAPNGLSEEMLVHVLLLDDRPFVGLGAHVYGARSKSKNALGNKGLAALRRTKGMSKRDSRWFYDGPPPSGDKVADGEAVVRDTPSSRPGTRCCKGCGAILRRGNREEFCWPCEPPRVREPKNREYAPPPPIPDSRRKKWTSVDAIRAIKEWAAANGRPPSRSDWVKSHVGDESRPSANTIVSIFGSWSSGISAAGFDPQGNLAGARKGISPMWPLIMEALPATVSQAADCVGGEKNATRKALSRMLAAGWVYREELKGAGKGDRVLWHPMPQGMEAAA